MSEDAAVLAIAADVEALVETVGILLTLAVVLLFVMQLLDVEEFEDEPPVDTF